MSEIDNGTPDMWRVPTWASRRRVVDFNKFTPYLQIAKNCGMTTGFFLQLDIKE